MEMVSAQTIYVGYFFFAQNWMKELLFIQGFRQFKCGYDSLFLIFKIVKLAVGKMIMNHFQTV